MARRVITLDEKIEKAEAAVQAAKVKYDAALDTLEKLVTKRKELDDKRLWKRIIRAVNPSMRLYRF